MGWRLRENLNTGNHRDFTFPPETNQLSWMLMKSVCFTETSGTTIASYSNSSSPFVCVWFFPSAAPFLNQTWLNPHVYPLVNFHITMENHNFLWENQLFQWASQYGYVSHYLMVNPDKFPWNHNFPMVFPRVFMFANCWYNQRDPRGFTIHHPPSTTSRLLARGQLLNQLPDRSARLQELAGRNGPFDPFWWWI